MKIDVSRIIKINGAWLDVEFNEPLEELNSVIDDVEFDNSVFFKGRIENLNGVLKLEGVAKTEYTAKCYRCLKSIRAQISADVSDDFVPEERNNDVDAYTYSGNFVVIDKAVKDNIILNMPLRLICDENCKGFCAKCGVNLNEKECNCEKDAVDPRLEELKKFFNN